MSEQLKLLPDRELACERDRYADFERAIWARVDVIYYPADEETRFVHQWLTENSALAQVRTIPVFAFDSFPLEPERNVSERRDLIFVAGFAHPPNVDAARWLVNEILPLVHETAPNVHLYVVGSNPPDSVKSLAGEHVTVTGFVSEDQLATYYSRARVAVAPLRFGGGMKGKVVESMRYGVPCVTTSVGAQGLTEATAFLSVGDDPATIAEKIVSLLQDGEMWLEVSKAAQLFVRERFSEDALWKIVSRDIGWPIEKPIRPTYLKLDDVETSTSVTP